MKKGLPKVSIIILSWNTLSDTKTCLENIRSHLYKNKEIIVVDNGSTDGSKDYLSRCDDIIYIDLPDNTGFTGGQIAAFEKTSGDYLLLLNSDAVLDKNWINKAVDVFDTNEKIAAVGGKVFEWNEDNPVYDTTNQFYTYQTVDLHLGYASTMRAGESQIAVDSISGAAVMISRKAIETCGYFDQRFFAYYEETDLFARFQKAGFVIVYEPSLQAWHQIAKSTRSKPYFYFYHMHRNRFMFAYKNFAFIKQFVTEYTIDFLRAHKRLQHNPGSLDDKARVDAYRWNIAQLAKTRLNRSIVQRKFNGNYNEIIKSHTPGDDVTVVIPSYNYAEYLPECIESALAQTHKPHRIIVIDDGSKDDSVSIARSYKGVQVISKDNEGIVLTKNLGIQLSTTTWTIFLDADDTMEKHYIEKTLAEALTSKADVVYTDMEYIGAKQGLFKSFDFSASEILHGNFIHNSALINTTLLKNVGGYQRAMNGGYEDWELYLSLLEANARFKYCKESVLFYRQHEGSQSRNNSALEKGRQLQEQVRQLHPKLYTGSHEQKRLLLKAFRLFMEHPETPFIAIAASPLALARGVCDYAVSVRRHEASLVRTYIHKKRNRKNK